MTYSLIKEYRYSDPSYVNDVASWDEVQRILKCSLEGGVVKVIIFKYSSDGRLLGELAVGMHNLYYVVTSPNDHVLN